MANCDHELAGKRRLEKIIPARNFKNRLPSVVGLALGSLSGWRAGAVAEEKCCDWKADCCYIAAMKSSYELAMERLNKTAPAVKLTAEQKKEIAELESNYAAKIAGREIAMKTEIAKVAESFEKAEELRQQLVLDRKKFLAELEDKKERIRRPAGK